MYNSLDIEDLTLDEAEVVAAGDLTGSDVILIIGVIGVIIAIP